MEAPIVSGVGDQKKTDSCLTVATAPYTEVVLRPFEFVQAAQVGADRIVRNYRNASWIQDGHRKELPLVAQHASVAAELAVARVLGQYPTAVGAWDAGRHFEFSGLPDVGENVEVKRVTSLGATCFSFQQKDVDRTLAVCYVEEPSLAVVRVLGWVSGHKAVEAGWVTEQHGTGKWWYRAPLRILKLSGTRNELEIKNEKGNER